MRRTIILASSSPRRHELIRTLGIDPVIIASQADETVEPAKSPHEVVQELALRKALAVSEQLESVQPGTIVIGADTIVVLDGEILGKPRDEQDAARMLHMLQGRSHDVYSGVACVDVEGRRHAAGCRRTVVHMKPLTDDQIRRYVKTGEPMDKAGSYAIQGIGATFVTGIEGDYFNVVGLPLELLSSLLSEFGAEVI